MEGSSGERPSNENIRSSTAVREPEENSEPSAAAEYRRILAQSPDLPTIGKPRNAKEWGAASARYFIKRISEDLQKLYGANLGKESSDKIAAEIVAKRKLSDKEIHDAYIDEYYKEGSPMDGPFPVMELNVKVTRIQPDALRRG